MAALKSPTHVGQAGSKVVEYYKKSLKDYSEPCKGECVGQNNGHNYLYLPGFHTI